MLKFLDGFLMLLIKNRMSLSSNDTLVEGDEVFGGETCSLNHKSFNINFVACLCIRSNDWMSLRR